MTYRRVSISPDWTPGIVWPAWAEVGDDGRLPTWNGFADVYVDVYDAQRMLTVTGETLATVEEIDDMGDRVPVRLVVTYVDGTDADPDVREVEARRFRGDVWFVVSTNGLVVNYATEEE